MSIELSDSLKQELWRNLLFNLYDKYSSELKKNLHYGFTSVEFLCEKLGKEAGRFYPKAEFMALHEARDIRKLEKDLSLLRKEMSDLENKIEDLDKAQSKYSYCEAVILVSILEEIKKQLKEIQISVITHPNGEIEFLDEKNKVILKPQKFHELKI